MHWIYLLGLVVIVVGVAAVTGIQPKEGRPAPNTRLMSAARIVLVVVGVLITVAYFSGV